MGAANSRPIPGPQTIVLLVEDGGCSECVPRRLAYYTQPPFVQNGNEWEYFMIALNKLVASLWTEMWFFLLGVFVFFVFLILAQSGALDLQGMYINVTAAIFIVVGVGGLAWAKSTNIAVDTKIHALCAEYSPKLGVNVAYFTQWTGFCKPRHARIFRAVLVAPPAAPLVVGQVGTGAFFPVRDLRTQQLQAMG
eukprot:CAMPEP_0114114200 /NCGR_PEP_ID=MMETSP0043_2-20121206/3312_1 /TAXON_ID=464988 /ORGANISM="Hemiselmis andersenii, Strain CCMP644" /LENGTH=193 /DNA_ID=CAMNT_0001206387 /DNA_START=140 /DNA_END=717 /DNA_ORIENTATION=-